MAPARAETPQPRHPDPASLPARRTATPSCAGPHVPPPPPPPDRVRRQHPPSASRSSSTCTGPTRDRPRLPRLRQPPRAQTPAERRRRWTRPSMSSSRSSPSCPRTWAASPRKRSATLATGRRGVASSVPEQHAAGPARTFRFRLRREGRPRTAGTATPAADPPNLSSTRRRCARSNSCKIAPPRSSLSFRRTARWSTRRSRSLSRSCSTLSRCRRSRNRGNTSRWNRVSRGSASAPRSRRRSVPRSETWSWRRPR
jgi:hypothetical protein